MNIDCAECEELLGLEPLGFGPEGPGPECVATETNPALRARVDAHLSTCLACRGLADSLRTAVGALRTHGSDAVPEWLTSRVLDRWSRESAVAPSGLALGSRPTGGVLRSAGTSSDRFFELRRMALRLAAFAAIAGLFWGAFFVGENRSRGAIDSLSENVETERKDVAALEARLRDAEAARAQDLERQRIQLEGLRNDLAGRFENDLEQKLRGPLQQAREKDDELASVSRRLRSLEERHAEARVRGEALASRAAALERELAAARAVSPRLATAEPLTAPNVGLLRSIDMRGTDSRVVPELLRIAEGDDEDLARLALVALRRKLDAANIAQDEPPEQKPGALERLGGWFENVGGALGLTGEEEVDDAPVQATGKRRQEAARLRDAWRLLEKEARLNERTERL